MRARLCLLIGLFLLVCFPMNATADDGWFIPNPRKVRLPYSGTPTQAQEVRRVLEATIPGLKVMPDKIGRAILFEADPQVLKKLEKVFQGSWSLPDWDTFRK